MNVWDIITLISGVIVLAAAPRSARIPMLCGAAGALVIILLQNIGLQVRAAVVWLTPQPSAQRNGGRVYE